MTRFAGKLDQMTPNQKKEHTLEIYPSDTDNKVIRL